MESVTEGTSFRRYQFSKFSCADVIEVEIFNYTVILNNPTMRLIVVAALGEAVGLTCLPEGKSTRPVVAGGRANG